MCVALGQQHRAQAVWQGVAVNKAGYARLRHAILVQGQIVGKAGGRPGKIRLHARVAGLRAPAALGLAIPAAYAPAAYAQPFGPQFSACIRQPRSWEHSQAFEILAGYRGRLLVLSAEADAVIPPEIPPRLYEAAAQASWRAHHCIPEAGHKLDAHYAQRPEDRQRAYARIVELCGGGGAG